MTRVRSTPFLPTPSSAPLSVADYRARVAALVPPVPVTLRPALDCVGMVLAEDVASPVSLPPFDNSAMDGYAVYFDDVASASDDSPVHLPVVPQTEPLADPVIGMSGRHLDSNRSQSQAGASNNDHPEHLALKSAAQPLKRRVDVGDSLLL